MYDIFFLSNGEPYADAHYDQLLEFYPTARRVAGVQGISSAHKMAAENSNTEFFWVVDADNILSENTGLDFVWEKRRVDYKPDMVLIHAAWNPYIKRAYGYAGVKLMPRKLIRETEVNTANNLDFAMAVSAHLKVASSVRSTVDFGDSALHKWRSAFRECVKLVLSTDQIAQGRLVAWVTSEDIDIRRGAMAGERYAFGGENLLNINDYKWLDTEYATQNKF